MRPRTHRRRAQAGEEELCVDKDEDKWATLGRRRERAGLRDEHEKRREEERSEEKRREEK